MVYKSGATSVLLSSLVVLLLLFAWCFRIFVCRDSILFEHGMQLSEPTTSSSHYRRANAQTYIRVASIFYNRKMSKCLVLIKWEIHKTPTDPTDANVARVEKLQNDEHIPFSFTFQKLWRTKQNRKKKMGNKCNMTTSAIYEHLNEKNL